MEYHDYTTILQPYTVIIHFIKLFLDYCKGTKIIWYTQIKIEIKKNFAIKIIETAQNWQNVNN